MSLLPVLERELRAGARQTLTHALRVLAAATLLGVAGWFWLTADLTGNVGGDLFQWLHDALLISIWVLVPMLTADCISRERREGTLALLFLTPLRPANIVLAKAMAQGLRAFTLWLATIPVLTLPFIVGGVSWKEAVLSVLISFSSVCLALSAGLVVSARSRNAMRSLVAAGLLSVLFIQVLLLGMGLMLVLAASLTQGSLWRGGPLPALYSSLEAGVALAANVDGVWGSELLRPGFWRCSLGAVGTASILFFLTALWLVLGLTARTVARVWREEPPSVRVLEIQRQFTTPIFFQRFFHRWMRWELGRNPIGWLERRTWSARLVMWGWTAVVICIYSWLLGSAYPGMSSFTGLQQALAWLLLLSTAASAAGSFRRERETGLLELLLVAPLTEWQVIGGRLRGLWGTFLPPQLLMIGLWLYGLVIWQFPEDDPMTPLCFVVAYATLPIVGLYYSLACKNYIAAFLSTLLMGIAVPCVLLGAAIRTYDVGNGISLRYLFLVLILPCEVMWAGVFLMRLWHRLRQRKFAMP